MWGVWCHIAVSCRGNWDPAVVYGRKADNKFCIVIVHVFAYMYSMCWLCVCILQHYTLSSAYNYYYNFSLEASPDHCCVVMSCDVIGCARLSPCCDLWNVWPLQPNPVCQWYHFLFPTPYLALPANYDQWPLACGANEFYVVPPEGNSLVGLTGHTWQVMGQPSVLSTSPHTHEHDRHGY